MKIKEKVIKKSLIKKNRLSVHRRVLAVDARGPTSKTRSRSSPGDAWRHYTVTAQYVHADRELNATGQYAPRASTGSTPRSSARSWPSAWSACPRRSPGRPPRGNGHRHRVPRRPAAVPDVRPVPRGHHRPVFKRYYV